MPNAAANYSGQLIVSTGSHGSHMANADVMEPATIVRCSEAQISNAASASTMRTVQEGPMDAVADAETEDVRRGGRFCRALAPAQYAGRYPVGLDGQPLHGW